MAEAYQGSDYLAENENATAKTAAKQNDSQAAAQTAAQGKQKGLISSVKSDLGKDKSPEPAPGQTSQAPTNGGLIGAIKGSFKEGGKVPETGAYQLHKDEQVVPAGRASEYRKVFSQRGAEGKHKFGSK
jgi:hypothetical protein